MLNKFFSDCRYVP